MAPVSSVAKGMAQDFHSLNAKWFIPSVVSPLSLGASDLRAEIRKRVLSIHTSATLGSGCVQIGTRCFQRGNSEGG